MKKIFCVFFFLLVSQIGLKSQIFKVSVDTMYLNIKDIVRPATRLVLTHALKYKGNYYCFFHESGLYSFQRESKYFFIISTDGIILNNIEIPREIKNSTYFDFFIRNDSLLAKTYMDHDSFRFDPKKLKWEKIKEIDDRVYEDSNFIITYLDFGEWGETTWFIDKKSKKEYVLGTNGTIVNTINGKYYLTSGKGVIEITDPHKLKQSDEAYNYKVIEKKKNFDEGTNSLTGSIYIYKDTIDHSLFFDESKNHLITSFVYNDQLYQLCIDSIKTYIAKVENGQLVLIQNLGKSYPIFNWHYSFRGNNPDNNSRFLKFKKDKNTFGFIEIDKNKIDIHYLKHNLDSLNYLGSDGFNKFFDFVLKHIDNFSLTQAKLIEKQLGGTDMRTDIKGALHHSYYPNKKNFNLEGAKQYIKVEDKYIARTTEYYYTHQNFIVKPIFIEWTPTQPYKITNYPYMFFEETPVTTERFTKKFREIQQIITKVLNRVPLKKVEDNYIELTWNSTNGTTINLYAPSTFNDNKKEIRLVIYKE